MRAREGGRSTKERRIINWRLETNLWELAVASKIQRLLPTLFQFLLLIVLWNFWVYKPRNKYLNEFENKPKIFTEQLTKTT